MVSIDKYREENNVVCSDIDGNIYYTDDYVEWLEEQLTINNKNKITEDNLVDFACNVYDDNYNKDTSIRSRAKSTVKKFINTLLENQHNS